MKLKYSFEVVEIDEETIAVPVGEDAEHFRGIVKLNRTGAEIFSLLLEKKTEQEIIDSLCTQYEKSSDMIAAYVKEFLTTLEEDGVLIR